MIFKFSIIFFFLSLNVQSENADILLVKFKSSKFLSNDSHKVKGGAIIKPSSYYITFEVIKQIHSGREFTEKDLSFKMNLHSIFMIEHSDEMVLVVRKDKKSKDYTLLDWSIVEKRYCIDKKHINDELKEDYFEVTTKGFDPSMCSFIIPESID